MRFAFTGLVLFLGMAAVRPSACFAEPDWVWQNPLPQGNFLSGVATPDSRTVVALGDRGAVVTTTDGGSTWSHLQIPEIYSLQAVSFMDSNTGLAVGYGGAIFR